MRDRAVEALSPPEVPPGGRAGIGFDAHHFEPGRPLRLGGLTFADEPRGLAGHSDGDAALHALIDALLGAAHLGDIGSLFPPDDPAWTDADSAELLALALERVRSAGFEPTGADLVIVAARPAIGPVRDEMEARIASILGIDPSRVSVKGTTSDGLGFAGEEGIAAYAVTVVVARS